MKVTVCDRCSKKIVGDSKAKKVNIYHADTGIIDCYDLCEECGLKIEGWLENAEDNDKREAAKHR